MLQFSCYRPYQDGVQSEKHVVKSNRTLFDSGAHLAVRIVLGRRMFSLKGEKAKIPSLTLPSPSPALPQEPQL
jgi:hypothetical protein